MTVVIKSGDKICFSIKPYASCPRGSTPIVEDAWSQSSNGQGNESEKDFHCMPRNTNKAKQMQRESRNTDILTEAATMHPNKMLPVKIAKRCARQQSPDF
jgi:hypothetical protein